MVTNSLLEDFLFSVEPKIRKIVKKKTNSIRITHYTYGWSSTSCTLSFYT
jgi:hypothetical protein